jgi:hypothetical protein
LVMTLQRHLMNISETPGSETAGKMLKCNSLIGLSLLALLAIRGRVAVSSLGILLVFLSVLKPAFKNTGVVGAFVLSLLSLGAKIREEVYESARD